MDPKGWKVFIGNIPPETEVRDLRDFFRDYGVINDCWVARKPPGFGFVWFDSERDARDAVRDKDRREILGNRVRVEMSNANKLTTSGRDDNSGDRRYGRSPPRYGRSPPRYGRSPERYGRSPERQGRSPDRIGRSPPRRSRSPRRRDDRSRSRGRGRSPRGRSPRGRSPARDRERSRSPN